MNLPMVPFGCYVFKKMGYIFVWVCISAGLAGCGSVGGIGAYGDGSPEEDSLVQAASTGTYIWPNGVIPYKISYADRRDDIMQAIKRWEQKTDLVFVPRNVFHVGYIDFVEVTENICRSPIGFNYGANRILLSSRCRTGTIVHEIGHAIGLIHEHQRADRDSFISVREENIKPGNEREFSKIDHSNDYLYTDYDYNSIMHYSSKTFSKNEQPTIIKKQGGSIGEKVFPSDGDAEAVHHMYGL